MNPFLACLPIYFLPPALLAAEDSPLTQIARFNGYTETPEELANRWGLWGISLWEFIAVIKTHDTIPQ